MGNRVSRAKRPGQPGMALAVYQGLRDEIASGRLPPGSVLSRREIAERYGASYTPVVEAVVRLENTGLIEAAPSQMARVRSISLEAIEEDYTLREAYETQAIRMACKTAVPAEIEELYELAKTIDAQPPGGSEEGAQIDWQFHEQISRISRSRALLREMQRLGLLRMFLRQFLVTSSSGQGPSNHTILVDAISHRHPDEAEALLREHLHLGRDVQIQAYRMQRP